MKRFLALLLSAILLLTFAACKGKNDDDDTTSKPTSQPSASQGDNSQGDSQDNNSQGDNSQSNSQGNNSQGNNSQGGTSQPENSTPSTPVDPAPTDLTVYVPYSADINKDNSQYFPPSLGADGSISPGVTVQGTQFEAPEVFEAKKAITALKNEVPSITAAKLQEYVSKYAAAYNKHYSKSNYKLAVSVSGGTVKYTYTISGEPATRSNSLIVLLLNGETGHYSKYADFYNSFFKDQIKSYKEVMPGINKIELCIIRADNDPNLGKDNYSKNVLSKTYS